ncbi:hypothetical protein AALP_AA7G128100 [Arabis alpina]|uniref:Uncharacterized protein n=1 Tax=Arabis alpina TaxID=50452 RepID=A0A087GHP4_ARAAL|nr:hypothetical protein AALP_AA7G128100 [Arabis alpina]
MASLFSPWISSPSSPLSPKLKGVGTRLVQPRVVIPPTIVNQPEPMVSPDPLSPYNIPTMYPDLHPPLFETSNLDLMRSPLPLLSPDLFTPSTLLSTDDEHHYHQLLPGFFPELYDTRSGSSLVGARNFNTPPLGQCSLRQCSLRLFAYHHWSFIGGVKVTTNKISSVQNLSDILSCMGLVWTWQLMGLIWLYHLMGLW